MTEAAERHRRDRPDELEAFQGVIADMLAENLERASKGLNQMRVPTFEYFKKALRQTRPAED